ncbi:flavin-containing monooxygenase [Dyella tabacisoli]|uniref:NAD(P)/FAD-dependent oxidoreductase n=1 Tax=Dyella tabacisoli TaxID=2282381 RepID=A0A369UJD1_9GAMM|nr:NAD(P)/FAD-dependent oxidoreductase [Dyella tabacisoli]RDD79828.1 NAD(P)/FAD-dependent oxidoreductase [Dyella tabacisoli]
MATNIKTDFDAIVIGTGIAGIYMLHKLRNELGLKVRAFDKAGGVGGTWYWNQYPGARSDTESFFYRYSFDKETFDGWDWRNRYAHQPEMRAYLNAIVERHHLGGDIQLNTGIHSVVFDDARHIWTLTTDKGEVFTARYVVSAVGVLSKTNYPEIKGRETFRGELVHTSGWPADLKLEGKRVGIIGTGSTGVQFICAAAKTVKQLTVFQRSAQYCVPAGPDRVSDEYVADYKANYEQIWDKLRTTRIGCGFDEGAVSAMSVSAEERQRVFQEHWDIGNGFRFMFGTFSDIAVDPAANDAAADFIRAKIKEIVKDTETARKLTPTDLYAKRPVCINGYYETYNRDNVTLVSLKENPIKEMTPNGVITEDGVEHELDVLVCATGFECVEGSYGQMDIRGRRGESLQQHWKDEPSSYLGIATSGFPNLLMILGPNSVFSNLAAGIETQVEWVAEMIGAAESGSKSLIEATRSAEDEWTATCKEIANYTLFPQVKSWIFGANIPGKSNRVLFYFGGLGAYRQRLREIADADYDGFVMDSKPSSMVA